MCGSGMCGVCDVFGWCTMYVYGTVCVCVLCVLCVTCVCVVCVVCSLGCVLWCVSIRRARRRVCRVCMGHT